jgi:serine/threonine-protein kinase RIO1
MVRSSADCNVLLLVNFMLSQTTAAAPKEMSLYGQMMGNYVEHRVDEDEAMAEARTLHPELSKYNCMAVRSECR